MSKVGPKEALETQRGETPDDDLSIPDFLRRPIPAAPFPSEVQPPQLAL